MFNNVHQMIEKLIDVCFPPSTDARIVRNLTDTKIRTYSSPRVTSGVLTLSTFDRPEVRALIHEAKFNGNKRAQQLLALLIVKYVAEHKKMNGALWIPIPLSPARLRSRGYNQVREILRFAERDDRIEISESVLIRARDTRPQVELSRNDRLTNMKNAFMAHMPEVVRDRDIIIIDDVMTTGSTLHAAEAVLLPYTPRSLTLIALAH